ncbi:MAG: sulfatase [Planctomycetota bacterium]|nr:MAG: sulfatase [Planctomycetota bacterium]
MKLVTPQRAPMRYLGLLVLPVLVFVGSGLDLSAHERARQRPPNFVFILADDLGWRDLGCYGSSFYETPRLDALAASGMRFTSAYAACPVCSPTRSSIQSGKYPARTHNTDYFGGPQPQEAALQPKFKHRRLLPAAYLERLALEETTIAEALQQAGYATFFAGKWHLGPEGYWPEQQGYDANMGGNTAGLPKSYFSPYQNPTLSDGPPLEHLDLRLAKATAAFIGEHRESPFFACFCLYDVHLPLQTTDRLRRKYRAKAKRAASAGPRFGSEGQRDVRLVQDHAVFAGMVETMDAAVGIVLDALEDAGVADNTIVVFTSDNGGLSTAEGAPTSNVPLRAGKGWMYEGGIRVPLIVRAPGVTQPAAQCDTYISSVDYYPTLLELAGQAPPAGQLLDGKSFVPLLRGDENYERGPIYWHYPHYGNQGGQPAAAIRDGDWKLITFLEDGRSELYNLASDLSEKHDLAAQEPQRVATMREQLAAWQGAVGAPAPSPNPRFKGP